MLRATIRATGYLARNWYTLLQIMLENVSLFASNGWKHLQAFFTNLGSWLAWLPANWLSVIRVSCHVSLCNISTTSTAENHTLNDSSDVC